MGIIRLNNKIGSFFIFALLTTTLNAQVSESKIKALYIYQIAQQVEWTAVDTIEQYTFGIFTRDTLLISNLKQIAKTSDLKDKNFRVNQRLASDFCSDCNLVFVDFDFINQLPDIHKDYSDKQVLIISYKANNKLFTMVNLYQKANEKTITYEINRDNLLHKGFTYSPELLAHGISLIDLKELYLTSAKELLKNKAELEKVQVELEQIEEEKNAFQKQIATLVNRIEEREKEYQLLNSNIQIKDSVLQKTLNELNQQLKSLRELESSLEKKQTAVRLKQFQLDEINTQYEDNLKLIADQSIQIMEQKSNIDNQQDQITAQTEKISNQRLFILLLGVLGIVFIAAIIAIFIAFRLRKQINSRLKNLVEKRTLELNISKEYYRTLAEYSPVPLFELNITELLKYLEELSFENSSLVETLSQNSDILDEAIDRIMITDFNLNAANLFEVDNIENFRNAFKTVFTKEETSFLINGFQSLANRENTYTNETVLTSLHDHKIQAVVTWIQLPESLGQENHLLIAVHDITKLKAYESELKKHRDNLELLVKERAREIVDLNKQLTHSNESLNSKNTELQSRTTELEETLKLLKSAQNQLIESEKMASLGMLTAGVAHEINNPINFINSGSQILQMIHDDALLMLNQLQEFSHELPDSYKDKLTKIIAPEMTDELFQNFTTVIESIDDGVNRTIKIVNSLRAYSYDSSEQFQNYDLTEAIDNSLLILKSKIKGKIEVQKNIEKNIEFECLPGKINQVVLNLISNAVDAIEDKGTIEITAHKDEENNYINLYVKDSGCGISKENISKIFEPFFTTKTVGTGTGLGLYISYGIISQHNGAINFESKPGKGTTVKVYLPINRKN